MRVETLGASIMYPLNPIIGVLICILVLISISAAIRRGTQWRLNRSQGADFGPADRKEFMPVITRSAAIPYLGSCGALGVPVALAAACLCLLVFPGSWPQPVSAVTPPRSLPPSPPALPRT